MPRGLARGILIAATILFTVVSCGDDDEGLTSSDPNNRVPEIQAVRDTAVTVGDTLRIQARAVDLDGDDITYEVAVEVTWTELQFGITVDAGMDPETGWCEFRPAESDKPGRQFHFTANDGRGGSDTASFYVEVN